MDIRRDITLSHTHNVRFTQDAFASGNETLASVLTSENEGTVRVLIFIDDQLDLGTRTEPYFEAQPSLELVAAPIALPGGEAAKNDWSHVETIWRRSMTTNSAVTLTSSPLAVAPSLISSASQPPPRIAASATSACPPPP